MQNKRHWHVMIELLRSRPHAIGAEIGVFRGVFAERLLRSLPGITKYYCVDPWEHYEGHLQILVPRSLQIRVPPQRAFKIFKAATKAFEKKIVVVRKMSQDALADVPDESLDWVFIDANHAYEYAKPDIIGWSKKVKIGGIISGHDYHDHNRKRRPVPFGVGKAVKELIPDYKVEVNTWYTVKETESWISLAT